MRGPWCGAGMVVAGGLVALGLLRTAVGMYALWGWGGPLSAVVVGPLWLVFAPVLVGLGLDWWDPAGLVYGGLLLLGLCLSGPREPRG